MPRRDPIHIFLLRSIIIRPVEKRDKTDRMPAQRMDEARWDFGLSVIVGDCFPEKPAAVRRAQGFERVRVQPGATDPGKNRVEQMLRQYSRRGRGRTERERRV